MRVPDNVGDDVASEWQLHPITEHLRKEAAKDLGNELKHLLNICADSKDPKVSAAFARHNAAKELVETFGGVDG